MSDGPVTVCGVEYLYRYFAADGAPLYNGVSNDWTRRLREHWHEDEWTGLVTSLNIERFHDRRSVLAAEAASIRAEHPRFNVQHNRHGITEADLIAGRQWTAEDIILLAGLVVLAGYVIYKCTTIAIDMYRERKAERAEFMAWRHARAAEAPASDPESVAAEDNSVSDATGTAEPPIVGEPEPVTMPELVTVSARVIAPIIIPIVIPKTAPMQSLPVLSVSNPVVAVVVCAARLIQARKGKIDGARFTRLYPPH